MRIDFPATRADGLARLQAFLPRAGRAYASDRNSDLGPEQRGNVSVLSPYLRYRLLTEHEVVAAVLSHHTLGASEKYIQEVLWRTYWKGWLELRPAIWARFTAERDTSAQTAQTGGLARALASAEAGATGIDCFDHWARELVVNGYLHNHARMWFASIWIFTLRLPWTLGADFFLRHLLDADPASNTLSWRWVAGLQTPGKAYLATPSNIALYTDGRFEPQGLATRADPLLEALPIPDPRPLPPKPTVGLTGPALLLVTGEDLSPETLLPRSAPIAGALIACGVGGREPWPWGDAARSFVAAAGQDAANRVSGSFDCSVHTLDTLVSGGIIAAAKAAGVRSVVTAYAPVGPTADALDRIEPELLAAGLNLNRMRRSWDDRLWPSATKGFFHFKSRIPEVLSKEGLVCP